MSVSRLGVLMQGVSVGRVGVLVQGESVHVLQVCTGQECTCRALVHVHLNVRRQLCVTQRCVPLPQAPRGPWQGNQGNPSASRALGDPSVAP